MWSVKSFGLWAINPETQRAERLDRQVGAAGVASTVGAPGGLNTGLDGVVAGQIVKNAPRDREVAWLPFPGHKRNAPDDDIYFDRELGPGPAKLIAVDEHYTDVVLAPGPAEKMKENDEMGWTGVDWRSFKGTAAGGGQMMSQNVPPVPADEEMQEDGSFDNFTGAYNKCLENIDGGDGTKKVHEIKDHGNYKMHEKAPYKDLKSCLDHVFADNKVLPKLVVSEGLQNLLREPSEGFSLPRTLMTQARRESVMAIVPWNPQLSSSSSESTCARTTISNRVKTSSQSKQIVVKEEEDKEEVMDLSV